MGNRIKILSNRKTPPRPILLTRFYEPLVLSDDVTIVWLDAKANENSIDISNTRKILEELQTPAHIFEDLKTCTELLSANENKKARVFLIVSGKFSKNILADLEKLPVIDSVFIYCTNPNKYNHLLSDYTPHVIGIFNQPDTLKLTLQIELNDYHTRAPILNFFSQKQKTIRDLTYNEASFLWFQLLQKLLLKTKYDVNDMKQMLEYCREHYSRDPQRQKFFSQIDEFEKNYTPTDSIHWYTRQSFVYKLINQALRTEDIEALYIFRYYISNLCQQLEIEHKKLCDEHADSPILTVYRGCHMNVEELDRLQDVKSAMISINGFVSTSTKPVVADVFSSRNSHRGSDIQKVLWIIEVDCRLENVIFAHIAKLSQIFEEEEVLFNIGTAFHINNITFDKIKNIWHINATVTNAGLDAVDEYMKLIRDELNETSEKVIFGMLLMDMGKQTTAQKYFEDLIEHSDKNHPDLPAFHYNLGLIYLYQNDLPAAEKHLRQALDDQLLNVAKQRNVVRINNALGLVCQESGDLTEALRFYTDAELICNEKLGSNDIANAQTYTYIGRYYLEKKKYSESIEYYERAMKILHLRLPKGHQRFGILLTEMGNVYRKENRLDQALRLYQDAEKIFEKILPEHHPCKAYCWSMMGLVYLEWNNIEEARQYHEKALKSYKRVLSDDHPNIQISENNLKSTCIDHIIDMYLQVCSQV